jgi:hypothetical protein
MANDLFELRVSYVDTADRMQSVLHYQSTASDSPTPELDATQLATAWDTALRTLFLACFPISTLYTSVSARRINNTGGPSFYGPAGGGVQGTALASEKVDASISALLTAAYNDALVGGPDKWRVARLFMGSVPFNFLQDNVWSSTAIAAYGAVGTALSGTITTAGPSFSPAVYSRKHSAFTGPLTWFFQPTIACLRKRAFPSR